MLKRRLIILFVIFTLGFVVLTARLIKLQLVDAEGWREVIRQFVHRTRAIETFRGNIMDRNGERLATDVPADELAIDYRAMNLDDKWLTKTAGERLAATPEWAGMDRASRRRKIDEMKLQLADQIQTIPGAISQVCNIPLEEVLDKFQDIRERIRALREDLWSQHFDREVAMSRAATGGGGTATTLDDPALNAATRPTDTPEANNALQGMQLREELIAHTIRSNIPPEVANYFRQNAASFPGLVVRDNANRRDYPFGEATAHVVGTLRSVDSKTVQKSEFKFPDLLAISRAEFATGADTGISNGNLGGYLKGDRMGESGAEAMLEPLLRGRRGARLITIDDKGDEPADESTRMEPEHGQDVRLTIDAKYQRDLYNAIQDPEKHLTRGWDAKNHFVAMVVMDISNGEILALFSNPSYDPNKMDDLRVQLNRDEYRHPLLSRAVSASYAPGSTIKPILASAGLSEQVITPESTILCMGHLYLNDLINFKCLGVHGDIRLVDALAHSCNVYFYTVGERLGVDRLSAWYDNYGFGHDTGMELPEAKGDAPKAAHFTAETAKNSALMLGIGQGPIDVTPLQMASAYATLLRGGVAVQPRILTDTPPKVMRVMDLPASVVDPVRQGMEKCVASGTAHESFRGFHLPVAGKTGTAEAFRKMFDEDGVPMDDVSKPLLKDGVAVLKADGSPAFAQLQERQTHAWFVGYAPADKPRYVVATIMEWGGHGGAFAAPMVREAFLQLEVHGYLPKLDVP